MAVKRYDGSAWQTVAGLGAQGPAATSSSITTWVKTASGGETSMSGNDDSSQPLSYTVGQELVYINGVLQKRGDDYTATTGNSITGLTALTAGDIVSVWTVNAFSVTNAISNTIVDAKGDLLVGTAADTPGRLAVGTNGQYLQADSTTGTGLKWASVSAGGMTLLSTTTLSGSSVTISSISGSYTDLVISVTGVTNNTAQNQLNFTVNNSATNYSFGHQWAGGTYTNWSGSGNLLPLVAFNRNVNANHLVVYFPRYSLSGVLRVANVFGYYRNNDNNAFMYDGAWGTEDTGAISSITLSNPGGTFASGTVRIYGVS